MNPNGRERSRLSHLRLAACADLVAADVRRLTSSSGVGCGMQDLKVRASSRACCPSGIFRGGVWLLLKSPITRITA